MSNLASYVTAQSSAAGTTLYVDPTGGGGAGYAFGLLAGTQKSIAALLAAGDIRITPA